ncbi:MAG: cyclic nucleotide-binding domain-containing protein [Pseudomonadota bacterium]
MKGILGLLRKKIKSGPEDEPQDSMMFTTAFAGLGLDSNLLVPWEARAVEVGAARLNSSRGTKLLQALWAKDKYMHELGAEAIGRLERFMDFATVAANRDLIRQEEYGNFMVVLLSGSIAIDRVQPWGERFRLAEAVPGEIMGEMSLLDSGMRFSACTTLQTCEVAILSAETMDEMVGVDPALAASLIALLARKLSLRLRVVSARLTDKK